MDDVSTAAARAGLAVLLIGTVLAQTLLPQLASDTSRGMSEVSHLAAPYSAVAIAAIACLQGALAATWRLLSLVRGDEVLTVRSLRCVDAFAVLVGAATVLAASPMVHLLGVVGVGGPGIVLALAAVMAGGATLVLLVGVGRQVLARAIAYRSAFERAVHE